MVCQVVGIQAATDRLAAEPEAILDMAGRFALLVQSSFWLHQTGRDVHKFHRDGLNIVLDGFRPDSRLYRWSFFTRLVLPGRVVPQTLDHTEEFISDLLLG